MASFDFSKLIIFLQSLFDAFVKLMEKFGVSFGADEAEEAAPEL